MRFQVLGISLLASCLAAVAASSPSVEKWQAHAWWRELMARHREPARWFEPGSLGHEWGAKPPPLSPQAYLTRALGGIEGEAGQDWARHNRLTPTLSFSHNLAAVFPPALFETHPEFFPMEDGQRLRPPPNGPVWWQPDIGREDVAQYAAASAGQFFDAHPDAVSFSLGINDGLFFGDSPETRALTMPVRWFRGRPDYSNLVFTFMNRAAAILAKSHPGKYLGALAYYWAEDAPDFPVRPDVIPFLTADQSQGYDPAFLRENQALWERWLTAMRAGAQSDRAAQASDAPAVEPSANRSGGRPEFRIGLYDYIYGGGFLIPRQHPHLLAEQLREARRMGFTDFYAEVYPNWGLDGPQPWLVAQLLQNPQQNADQLLNEYYRRYFKEAAAPMRRFFERCEQIWLEQGGESYWLKYYRNEAQAGLFPPAVCRELRGYLDQAAHRAKHYKVEHRVRQVSDAFGVTERLVTMHFARVALDRAVLHDSLTPVALTRLLSDYLRARTDFVAYAEALRREQPLLIAPFKMEDYLLDSAAEAVIWLRRHLPAGAALPDEFARDPAWGQFWRALGGDGKSLLADPRMSGPPKPVPVVSGLRYHIGLPAPWLDLLEPAEHFRGTLGRAGPGVLNLAGSINTAIFQWQAWSGPGLALAGLSVRGRVSASSTITLNVGWLDSSQRNVGVSCVRLPAGDWPEWVRLRTGALAPPAAAWVGVSLQVSNQTGDDWLEAKDFELEAFPTKVEATDSRPTP